MAGPAVLPPGDSRSKCQPIPRFLHASAQIGREILVYSGLTKEYPVEKRQHWASVVELFDPYREEWRIEKTTGEPRSPGCGLLPSHLSMTTCSYTEARIVVVATTW